MKSEPVFAGQRQLDSLPLGMQLALAREDRFGFHLISSGVNVSPCFTASRIGRGGPFCGTVTSIHNSSPGWRRDGSIACSGKKKATGSESATARSPARVLQFVTRRPVGCVAG